MPHAKVRQRCTNPENIVYHSSSLEKQICKLKVEHGRRGQNDSDWCGGYYLYKHRNAHRWISAEYVRFSRVSLNRVGSGHGLRVQVATVSVVISLDSFVTWSAKGSHGNSVGQIFLNECSEVIEGLCFIV